MALNKTALAEALKAAFLAAVGVDDDMETLTNSIADAVDTFVKTGNATGADAPSGDTHNLTLS